MSRQREIIEKTLDSVDNMAALAASRNEQGGRVLGDSLTATICRGLMTNLQVLDDLAVQAEQRADGLVRERDDARAAADRIAAQHKKELDAVRFESLITVADAEKGLRAVEEEMLEKDKRFAGNVKALQAQLDRATALLDLVHWEQRRSKADRRPLRELKKLLK